MGAGYVIRCRLGVVSQHESCLERHNILTFDWSVDSDEFAIDAHRKLHGVDVFLTQTVSTGLVGYGDVNRSLA